MLNFHKRVKTRRAKSVPRRWSFEPLEHRMLLAGDVVMFNDHAAGPATHPFTTTYAFNAIAIGPLRNSETGANTAISLTTQSNGATFESAVEVPAPGTDAHTIFNGWVDFTSQPGSSIALIGNSVYTHNFSSLDDQKTYEFTGTAVRGDALYTNRWTLVTIVGADSFTPAHSSGVGIVTAGLAANQVALWTGANHQPDQGFVVQWEDIDPGSDGTFQITSQQYLGLTPGVGTGSAATNPKGYALTAIRLVEHDPSFRVIGSDPADGALLTSGPTIYTVHFNLPVNPTTIQASDLKVDNLPATAVEILDADTVRFTIPQISSEGFHTVTVAAGAIQSSGVAQPLLAYSASYAIISGSGVVINEVNYDPGSDADPWEYIELFNAGSSPVNLAGWQFTNGVSYTIPNGTMLGSGQYLLVAQHPAELASRYGVSALGPYEGRLSNEGETLRLVNSAGVVQDEVDYQLGFPWPTIGDIPGQSMQLINPALDNGLGGNWRSAEASPAGANRVLAFNSPPQMRQVNHSPEAPVTGQDVHVTMKVTDPQGVASVSLQYQLVNPGDYIAITDPRYATNWTALAMRDDGLGGDAVAGDSVYTGVLPGNVQTHRRLVRYRVTAVDTLGASVTAPYADDPQANFAYFVYDAIPNWTGAAQPGVTPAVTYDSELLNSVANYHLITTRTAHVDSQFIPNSTRQSGYGGSDYLWHGALVYDGVVYDHIRYRARGGVWRYAMGKNMWKFDFNRGHGFEARDDYGNKYEVPWSKLNLSAVIQQGDFGYRGEQGLFESVGFKLFNLAGVAASNTNYVHFRIVESANQTGANQFSTDFQGLYLAVEQLDDQFLEEHGLPDGNLYKMEGGTGVGGIGGELNNQGDYPQPDDSSDLIEFKTTYQSGAQSPAWWRQNLNLDSYYSYRSIVEAIHHYDIDEGAGKNYFFYHNPETDKWETMPWDIDLTWADNMYGNGDEPFRDRVLPLAEFAVEYRNRMREIRDLLYNQEQVGLVIDEMASFVYTPGQPSLVDADRAMWDYNPILGQNRYVNQNKAGHGRFYTAGGGSFAGMIQYMKGYVDTRSDFIDSTILTDEAVIPFEPTITYSGEAGFPLNRLKFTSSQFAGRGSAFAAMEWRIGEIYNPDTANYVPGTEWKYEIEPVWESGELTSFNNTLDITGAGLQVGHTYRARVRMKDAAGRWSHWSDPVQFVTAPPVSVPTLAITEVHYNPYNPSLSDSDDQEFIEIFNFGGQPVDLSGIQLADFRATPYVFAGGLSLAPGEYIVVARTPAVFASIYGSEINVAPTGYGNANLSNSGETITLLDASGSLIRRVTYSDAGSWPTAPDGTGPSLEIVHATGDPNSASNWRASHYQGGSPGNDGAPPPAIAGDYDYNGAVQNQDYAMWKGKFGKSSLPGNGADGNANRRVDAADYVVWRKNAAAQAASATSSALLSDAVGPAAVVTNENARSLASAQESLSSTQLARIESTAPTQVSRPGFRPRADAAVRHTAFAGLATAMRRDRFAGTSSELLLALADRSTSSATREIDGALEIYDGRGALLEDELFSSIDFDVLQTLAGGIVS